MHEKLETQRQRAHLSLRGLCVGDAFGETFFGEEQEVRARIGARQLRTSLWNWTDDTAMARVLVRHLGLHEKVKPDRLAWEWAEAYDSEKSRGYGGSVQELLQRIYAGGDWRSLARMAFGGQGSWGNGAAMRVAPLGAFFAEDPAEKVAEMAREQATITHANTEAQDGAVAVALAAMWACQDEPRDLIKWLVPQLPAGLVRDGVERALTVSAAEAAQVLGNGSDIRASDTVPYALWCVAQQPDNYEEAIWLAVSALGDRDTICAIVGGIVILSDRKAGVPPLWRERCEPL